MKFVIRTLVKIGKIMFVIYGSILMLMLMMIVFTNAMLSAMPDVPTP